MHNLSNQYRGCQGRITLHQMNQIRRCVSPHPEDRSRHAQQRGYHDRGVEKDAESLQSALADIAAIRLDLLPRMSVVRAEKSINYEWLDAIDAVNMVAKATQPTNGAAARAASLSTFRVWLM